MPFNGSGTYQAPASPGAFNPSTSGGSATPTAWNTLLDDIESALSTVICKDGQTTISQNIPFNDKRITGLGDATAQTDALNGRSSWWIFDQQSVSAVSVIDFIDIPSTVNNIQVVFEGRPGTDAAQFVLQTYDAAGNLDNGASDYAWWTLAFSTAGGTPTVAADGSDSTITLTGSADNGVTGVSGFLHAENIQAATYTKFSGETNYLESTGVSGVGLQVRGQRLEADRITGVRIAVSAGTFTGKATLYASI